MSLQRSAAAAVLLLLGSGYARAIPPFTPDSRNSNTMTSVSARATDAYSREKLGDGSYAPETYAFGEGGYFRAPISDPTIDNLTFMDVARIVAGPLSAQNYVPTKDPKRARLLIMLYWGMTSGSRDPSSAAFNRNGQDTWGPDPTQGAMTDARNATILGYDNAGSWDSRTGGFVRPNSLADVQWNRYFVVLMAYDFQVLWKDKKHKLLWETRYSVRQQGNDFDKLLPAMTKYASQYFGQDTQGIVGRPLPVGNVEVGTPKSIGFDTDRGESLSDTTLIAGPKTFAAASPDGMPDTRVLPAALAGHIESYRKDRAALQDALVAKIKEHAPGDDMRQAIDAFNAENSSRISALNRDAESIRNELAKFAAEKPVPDGSQSIDTLVQQFSDNIKSFEMRESLFAHP
jgi:hypothetical protein